MTMATMVAIEGSATQCSICFSFLFYLGGMGRLVVFVIKGEMFGTRLMQLVRIRHGHHRLHRNQGDHQVCNGVAWRIIMGRVGFLL